MMKFRLSFALVAFLATSAPTTISVSAFAPGKITSANLAPNSIRKDIENGMIRREDVQLGRCFIHCYARASPSTPARSQEEDLELTRAIIMKHISSTDKKMTGYDDDDDEEDDKIQNNFSVKSKSVADDDNDAGKMDIDVSSPNSTEVGKTADDDGGEIDALQRLKKIKSFGTQIKDDLKSRFGKVREEGVALKPLKNIKSFGTKIKDDLKSRLGRDE